MIRIENEAALTYDDVLLRPAFSKVLPKDVRLNSRFSKNITLNIPIVSAAMDTVTESDTAIVLAQEGGIGVIHKNLTPDVQAKEVSKVKKYEAGMVLDPISVYPEMSLHKVTEITKQHKITGVLVVDKNKKLLGILTSRDMRFEDNLDQLVKDIMTPREKLITADIGISRDEAKKLLHKHRIEKLPVVNKDDILVGLITIRDIKKTIDFPNSNKDGLERLRVAAAVGVGPKEFERAKLLADAGVDAIVVDTAHGHS